MDFRKIKNSIDKGLRARIDTLEKRGIVGADRAQLAEYRNLADQGELLVRQIDARLGGSGGDLARNALGAADFRDPQIVGRL
jgi:hypothetical protein